MANEKKLIGPYTTIWWFDTAALTTPMAPKVADFTAALAATPPTALNLSCTIVTGYTLNPTDSDTQNSRLLCDEGNAETRGNANYEATLQFAREADPDTNTTSIFIAPFEKFKHKGVEGYLVRRVGKKSTDAIAVGDRLDVFKVMSDNPRDIEEDGGGPIYMEVPFLAQGQMAIQVAAVA